MLPFTSIDFYILLGVLILGVQLLKPIYSRFISYSNLLFAITLFYVLFFFTRHLQLIGFAIYSYLIYYIFSFKFKNPHRLWVSLLLALPMILLKVQLNISWLNFAGLSYITFRTIQIFIDRQPDEKPVHPRDYFSFLVFTPTLLIGPIDRWQRFKNNLEEGYRNLNSNLFAEGWQNIALGVLQKYVMAEIVTRYWLQPEDNVHSFLQHINAAFAYTAYLYFDFAGYSSLAVGFGNMLGIKVPHNFNHPYLAVNPQDFWRRWHITLGDWLRDYFFRPIYKWLSGFYSLKKYPLTKQNLSLFFTFALMGCWNGLQHNYIWSGSIFGLYSVIHNTYLIECKKKDNDILFGKLNPKWVQLISTLVMICAAVFAIYVFSGRSGI